MQQFNSTNRTLNSLNLTTQSSGRVTATRLHRVEKIKHVLQQVFKDDDIQKPNVIVFPEYSVPIEAFQSIPFQTISNDNAAVIVAGSYFDAVEYIDNEKNPTFRNNLCRIFIPGRENPLVICKATASPAEIDFLRTSDTHPTVARLSWRIQDGRTVAISVFLCRDYLSPYELRELHLPDQEIETVHISMLDWENRGINIAVMNNDDPTLFEAAAAFDVRRLHGERKLVLLVNSGNRKNKLATSLLGASDSEDRKADVAARISPSIEGVMFAHVRLSKPLAVATETPDKERWFPVMHSEAFHLLEKPSLRLEKIKEESALQIRRGVFHPALLGALNREMVLEFFVVHSSKLAREALDKNRIQHVTAAHVRGAEDVMMRRFVERSTVGDGIPSVSTRPFSKMDDEEFNQIFESGLRVLIAPQDIRKIRGKRVPPTRDWTASVGEITTTLRQASLRNVISIAQQLPAGTAIPTNLERIFSLETEEIIPVGLEFGSEIRETYILVSPQHQDGTSAEAEFSIFVEQTLMPDIKVRDIYRIKRVVPHFHGKTPFIFLLRLKCSVFEADEILQEMQDWGAEFNIRVGTRSYDLWRYIKRGSIEGIIDSKLTDVELAFVENLFSRDKTADWNLGVDLRSEIANAISRQSNSLIDVLNCQEFIEEFYYRVALFNIAAGSQREKNFRSTRQQWASLYDAVEMLTKGLLTHVLSVEFDTSTAKISSALEERFPDDHRRVPEKEKRDPLRLFLRFYAATNATSDTSWLSEVAAAINVIAESRNWATHATNVNLWRKFITLKEENWNEAWKSLQKNTEAMSFVLRRLNQESVRLKIVLPGI